MNICLVTGIFPPDIGGPATFVPLLAGFLSAKGHQVKVVTLSDRPQPQIDSQYPFAVVRIARAQPLPLRWLRTVNCLAGIFKASDVIFANGLADEVAVAAVLRRRPMVLKLVGDIVWERAVNHGWTRDDFLSFQNQPQLPLVRCLKSLRNWTNGRFDRVIFPSRFLAQVGAKWGFPSQRMMVIYNGISDTVCEPVPFDLPDARVLAAVVGRLVPWKRVDGIIEAVAKINNLGLVVVGDGPQRERLERLAKKTGEFQRFCFTGSLPKNTTMGVMAACDIFVLNSTYEGLPHVLLEAQALGKPILATAAGGTPEVVIHARNGWLIPPGDQPALETALAALAGDVQLRKRLAQGARENAANFTLESTLEKTAHVLEEISREGGK